MTINVYVFNKGRYVFTHCDVPESEVEMLVIEIESDPFMRAFVERLNTKPVEVCDDKTIHG